MGLLKHKTVLVLLLVVVLNVGVSVLLRQLDSFIHVELYNYGLVFSLDWAVGYWDNNLFCWTFVIGATAFAILAMFPHYLLGKEIEPSRALAIPAFLLSVLAMVFETVFIFFVNRTDYMVRNTLLDFGVSSNLDWVVAYEPLIATIYGLTVAAVIVLVIPTIRSLGIVEFEIVDESD